MQGLMMNWQLTLDKLIEHANHLYPHRGVTTMQPDGSLHRMTYGEMYGRVKRLAKAMVQLGIEPGDEVIVCVNGVFGTRIDGTTTAPSLSIRTWSARAIDAHATAITSSADASTRPGAWNEVCECIIPPNRGRPPGVIPAARDPPRTQAPGQSPRRT